MEASQIPANGQQVVLVGAFSAKYRAKGEIYFFCTADA